MTCANCSGFCIRNPT